MTLPSTVAGVIEQMQSLDAGLGPDDPTVLADYLTINEVLASQEASIRRSFLDEARRQGRRPGAAHRMQTPVAGLASSRSSPIGAPHASHVP